MRAVDEVAFFLCELVALVAVGFWGWRVTGGPWRWVLVVAAPAAMIAAWGLLAAPTSSTRLGDPALLLFQLAVFLLAAAALWAVDARTWAVVQGVVAAVVVVLDRTLPATGGLGGT